MRAPISRLRKPGAAAVLALALVLACAGSVSDRAPAQAAAPAAQRFLSRPDLRPPPVRVLTPARETAPGFIFLAPKKDVAQAGPMILDDRGEVVWFTPVSSHGVTDFRVQRYRGRPVLTWWRGQSAKGVGDGHYAITDDSYRLVAEVRAGNGLSGDIHEFVITPQDTALFTIYRRVPRDLSALGGRRDGAILEGVVQEVDIATGRVLFEWHSFPAVAVAESYQTPSAEEDEPFDYFHINAVDVARDGSLLLSARNTHTVYKVRRSDGAVLWRLGGKRSDFRLGPGAAFAWQHDIRQRGADTYSLFDNAESDPKPGRQSRAILLRLDERRHTATLVASYRHRPPLLSTSQGNVQFLPGGHVFVGWGSRPYVTEFDGDGNVVLDLGFGVGEVDSYRAYRFPWTGSPRDRPAVAARAGTGGVATLSASWNGATRVERWRVVAGPGSRPVAERPRVGFETAIRVAAAGGPFRVQALDASGRVLATSRAVVP